MIISLIRVIIFVLDMFSWMRLNNYSFLSVFLDCIPICSATPVPPLCLNKISTLGLICSISPITDMTCHSHLPLDCLMSYVSYLGSLMNNLIYFCLLFFFK